MRMTFVRRQWENDSHTIVSLFFRPHGRYRYEPGQYAVIHLPHEQQDDRGMERTMTLTSVPDDPHVSFTMRYHGADSSSFKRALMAMQPSDLITIFDAMGDLVLPLDSSIPLVFVAGGVGIASFVGMTRWLTAARDARQVHLLHAARNRDDIVHTTPFAEYAAVGDLTASLYTPAVNSAYAPYGSVQRRRISAEDIDGIAKQDSLLYLSGPETMVMELVGGLTRSGIGRERIIFDYFD